MAGRPAPPAHAPVELDPSEGAAIGSAERIRRGDRIVTETPGWPPLGPTKVEGGRAAVQGIGGPPPPVLFVEALFRKSFVRSEPRGQRNIE